MASETPLSKANTSFALNLFKVLSDNDRTSNVFFSPLSISSAIAMVLLGARGNTATQMSEVLCFKEAEKPPRARAMPQMQMQMQIPQHLQQLLPQHLRTGDLSDEVHSSFGSLLQLLNRADAPYALSVANRLYGEKTYQFVEDFLEGTNEHYNAKLESVDFKNNSEEARVRINTWVQEETQGKILDLLVIGAVNDLTKLVLVNAIYFKGNWNKQFDETSTRDYKFRMNKNETKPVKMMHQKSKFPLRDISEASCQVIDLPYKGKELSMLVFLPNDIEDGSTGLEKLEEQLTYENFVEWTRPDMMDEVEVQVGFPRFKMEEKYDMKNVLTSMGMVDAFDMGKSDFSGMSPANDLVLSKVIHKAFVEVNEEGTEAAAATAVIISVTSFRPTPTFIADHPFLFFIRHNTTNSVLFAGKYCSPE
ncbi:unnamed protein product [Knipowitschia caucasica]|uniref:Serpin B6 n=2 Tax=Knipowitschia caucasica TaxID=637954 RepID=A0AAV2L5C7_KNICA